MTLIGVDRICEYFMKLKCERLVKRNGVLNQMVRCDVGNDDHLRDEESTMKISYYVLYC